LRYITSGIFFFLAVYSALYGVTYAYRLHHIVNAAFAWLVALHFSGSGWSVNQLDQTLRSAGLVDEKALGRGKKLP
ncbi:GPI inositol deacylase, partial [Ascosphaera atra]